MKSQAEFAPARRAVRRRDEALQQRTAQVRDTKGAADLRRGEAVKQSQPYVDRLLTARNLGGAIRKGGYRERRGVLQGFRLDSLAESQRRDERRVTESYIGEAGPDKPRTDDEIRRFLRTGQRPVRLTGAQRRTAHRATVLAPVIDVLEETTRPIHAVAGGARATLRGENVPKAVVRGARNQDKFLFSDVLKEAGVPGGVAGPLGFAGDVFLDPTTYVTGGTAAVARKGVEKAAKDAARRAEAAGLTPSQVAGFAERAGRQAQERASKARGVSLRFAGREVPGVLRATARVGQATSRATGGRRAQAVRGAVRRVGSDLNPRIHPPGIDREVYGELRRAARTARSSTSRGVAQQRRKAARLRDQIGEGNYAAVIDAIESGTIRSLPAPLREAAVAFRSELRHARRLERQAGIKVGDVTRRAGGPRGYVPHVLAEELTKGAGRGGDSRVLAPSFAKRREDLRPLSDLRVAEPGKFSENLPGLFARRTTEGVVAREKAAFNARVALLGRPVRPGQSHAIDPKTEAVYELRGSDLRKLSRRADKRRIQAALDGKASGQFTILNNAAIERAYQSIVPQAGRTAPGETFDQLQAIWKFVATQPNPGFHLRNFFGDMQNAYLGQSAPRLAVNTVRSARMLKRVGQREEAERRGLPIPADTRTLRVDGRDVTYADEALTAEGVGGIRSGFVSRELPELASDPTAVRLPRAGRPARGVGRFLRNREDLFRGATYIAARREGLSAERSAARVADHHFDYADLTPIERRALRRLMPFYTFSARNIPLQTRSLLQRPGKFAQYQKIREEVAKAFGLDLDAVQQDLSVYEQRSAPVVIRWKGHAFTLSLGPSGLPITDLNEFPLVQDPIKLADEWIKRGVSLVTPAAKSPIELWANLNFFFRDQIERDSGPLVPAPAYVQRLPDALKRKLHVTPNYLDRRTGRKGWGWSAKADYLATQFSPGPLGYIKRVLTPSERRQQGTVGKTVAYFGLRAVPVDPVDVRVQESYEDRGKIEKQLSELRQQAHPANGRKIGADNATPQYRQLLKLRRDLTAQIERLRRERGDVNPRASTSGGASPAEVDKLLREAGGAAVGLDPAEIEKLLQEAGGG